MVMLVLNKIFFKILLMNQKDILKQKFLIKVYFTYKL
jgi:hypothetical protein